MSTEENVLRIVIRPCALHSPPGMCNANTSCEILFSERELLREICPQQREALLLAQAYADRQHGSESHDVVAPENAFDFGQISFAEIRTVTGGLQVHATDFDVQRVFLWSHDQVRPVAAQLTADLVADVGCNGDHGGGHTNPEHDGNSSQEFAPLLAPEGFVEQAQEHWLLLEHAGADRDVRLPDNDRV